MIYERPSPPLSPRHGRDPPEASAESRTKSDARRRNTARPSESQAKPERTERVRINRERTLRQEEGQRARNDGDEGRRHTDVVAHYVPLERRLSYERQSYSPNELPPPSPPSQTGTRDGCDHGAPVLDDRNYGRGSGRVRTPSPSRNYNPSQQSRSQRVYSDGNDSRRLPARPRSPNSDIGDRGYGKAEARSAMSSRGGSLLDRLSADNHTDERDAMEDRFDERVTVADVSMTFNGQESVGERRDNGKRRRKTKGGRR